MTTRTDTDADWEAWGRQDPYFGVITNPIFRRRELTSEAREIFFQTGQMHVVHLLETCRSRLLPGFSPYRCLDFGCGVGRVLIPLAAHTHEAVGMDVSPSMLAEARQNAQDRGVLNCQWVEGGDPSVFPEGHFQLVHSVIVLQHIEVERGIDVFRQLLRCIAPGGIGALQLTYGKAYHPDTLGVPPAAPPVAPAPAAGRGLLRAARDVMPSRSAAPAEPPMLMNPYPLNPLMYLLQTAGVSSLHAEFTDHGGELGLFLFFVKP